LSLRQLRWLISKQFFISWGVVFAALIGLLAALATLFPQVRFNVYTSLFVVGLSALLGAGYAFRENRPTPLPPIDELVPEPSSSTGRLIARCSTTREVVLQVNSLAKRVYPGVRPLPPDRYEQWLMINDNILLALLNANSEVIGYFDIFPLQPEFFNFFMSGAFGEHDIRREHILAPDQARFAKRLYLGGIAVADPLSARGKRHASILVWSLLKYLQKFYCAPCDRELYAEAVTVQGERLLKRFNFRLVSSARGRKDSYPLYAAELSEELINHALSEIPDWSRMCSLGWESELPKQLKRRRQHTK